MRCLLFLNGKYGEREEIKLDPTDLLIAVDGGVKFLLSRGLLPHIFVGDADSVDQSQLKMLEKSGCEVMLYPQEKDEIDAELAIEEAIKRQAQQIIVVGWKGDRIDMILALIYLMARCKVPIKAVSDDLEMGTVSGEALLEAEVGEKWSILPICGDASKVTLKGFKYNLCEAVMPCLKPFGVSNVALSNRVFISVKEGKVVYFRWRREPL
ncbi:thiamine diphosphokinase [Pseudothermotoga thermarum]|uniref:Thiamine diphosphokinase n=1 Tax=Pseudothermotoga thermarum DSM 5069 TaxID=688269 RepID=F7YYW3_9THEM|nr:thiamine diphosphokinase [Pseudothermotoga thermarum]AEH51157.1 thiamine diphosphokinase [Pseudothermotoga thermarum DSM 5069]